MTKSEPKDRLARKRKSKAKKQFKLSYSLVLLILMVVVGTIAGLVAYKFGQQALQGVNPSPTGVKLPKLTPKASPSPSATPKKPDTTSFLLDEQQVILASQVLFNEQLGGLTRKPRFPRSLIQNPQNSRLAQIRDRLGLPRYREVSVSSLFKDSSSRNPAFAGLDAKARTVLNAEIATTAPSEIARFNSFDRVQSNNVQTIESLYAPVDRGDRLVNSSESGRIPTLPSMPQIQDQNSRETESGDLSGYPERALHLRRNGY
jgi:hypothetical protein